MDLLQEAVSPELDALLLPGQQDWPQVPALLPKRLTEKTGGKELAVR
jgi:hypothetical protein